MAEPPKRVQVAFECGHTREFLVWDSVRFKRRTEEAGVTACSECNIARLGIILDG